MAGTLIMRASCPNKRQWKVSGCRKHGAKFKLLLLLSFCLKMSLAPFLSTGTNEGWGFSRRPFCTILVREWGRGDLVGLSDCCCPEKTPVTKGKKRKKRKRRGGGGLVFLLSSHSAAAASSQSTNTCRPSAVAREKSILPCDNLASSVQREKTPCGRG